MSSADRLDPDAENSADAAPSTSTSSLAPPFDRRGQPEKHALIVVDMSVEQVGDVSYRRDEVIDNIRALASRRSRKKPALAGDSSLLFDLVVDSRLWLEGPWESTLSWVWEGAGITSFRAGSEGASLIPELRGAPMTFVRKYNYSCFAGGRCELPALFRSRGITHAWICGINTDYCVFATALDAFQLGGCRVGVVADAVTSVRGEAAHREGLRNIERHFGPHALATTAQLLERLGRGKAPRG